MGTVYIAVHIVSLLHLIEHATKDNLLYVDSCLMASLEIEIFSFMNTDNIRIQRLHPRV